jgi:hypothetical protein
VQLHIKRRGDLVQSQKIPDIPQEKETYRERSTVQMVTNYYYYYLF